MFLNIILFQSASLEETILQLLFTIAEKKVKLNYKFVKKNILHVVPELNMSGFWLYVSEGLIGKMLVCNPGY